MGFPSGFREFSNLFPGTFSFMITWSSKRDCSLVSHRKVSHLIAFFSEKMNWTSFDQKVTFFLFIRMEGILFFFPFTFVWIIMNEINSTKDYFVNECKQRKNKKRIPFAFILKSPCTHTMIKCCFALLFLSVKREGNPPLYYYGGAVRNN